MGAATVGTIVRPIDEPVEVLRKQSNSGETPAAEVNGIEPRRASAIIIVK